MQTMTILINILRSNLRPRSGKINHYLRKTCRTDVSSSRLFCWTVKNHRVGSAIEYWSRRFDEEGIPEPEASIHHILSHVIAVKHADLPMSYDKKLSSEQIKQLETLCECRLSRMPVQYIIGEWSFRDIELKLVPPIFIPRPETECLVDFVLKRVIARHRDDPSEIKILEIGCGSGAISLAILHNCSKMAIRATAIDQNPYACELAEDNAKALGLADSLQIVNATLEDSGTITTRDSKVNLANMSFDFIVSNPPYIPTAQIATLAPEIRIFEDLRALDGGPDGLKIIKGILKYSSRALKPSGYLFLEVDPSHPESISHLTEKLVDLKLKYEHTYKDYCNNDRFVEIRKRNLQKKSKDC